MLVHKATNFITISTSKAVVIWEKR